MANQSSHDDPRRDDDRPRRDREAGDRRADDAAWERDRDRDVWRGSARGGGERTGYGETYGRGQGQSGSSAGGWYGGGYGGGYGAPGRQDLGGGSGYGSDYGRDRDRDRDDRWGRDDRAGRDDAYTRAGVGGGDRMAAMGTVGMAGPGWSPGRQDRERPSYRGHGPQGYARSDQRITEDLCDRLTDDHDVDARMIEVRVEQGLVTLTGRVTDRRMKYRAEEIAEEVSGVKEVDNQIRVSRDAQPTEAPPRKGGAKA